ncbi:MAG: hypothetical protein NTY75_04960 [Candidatus Shapirobacteria bacterium]|nr:hypothetical protein [Candidatus Shapirobacteria bacterium]
MTPQDLKQIGSLLDEKLEEKLEQKLNQKFDEKLKDIKSDIAVLKDQNNRTEKHIQSIDDHLIEWKSELFDIVDGLAGETRDQPSNTNRIEKLETKVFGAVTTA